jgi:hypothetical protein
MFDHLDETGQPCTRHPAPTLDALLALAAIGSRMPGFHHDCASKLQSLMMSIDEIGELATTDDLRQIAETAGNALRELHQLFTANRALAKSPQLARDTLADLIERAADRAGVKTRGEITPADIQVSPPAMTHALAVLLDLAAGPSSLGRVVDVQTTVDGTHATLVIAGPPGATAKIAPNTSELLAIASFVVARDSGELRCIDGGARFKLRMLIAGF